MSYVRQPPVDTLRSAIGGHYPPPTPLEPEPGSSGWIFESSVGHPLEWRGEGERCPASWPEDGKTSRQQCELVPHQKLVPHRLTSPL